ncbi:hypothetical protein HON71_02485 [Candidatus Woesearchaeota archaeon]|jgi:hypothetical protein|nr:hypothetical protein [Candidatus Woesearchaeota archaeon]MBT5342018.1 hypothetical protein [Candidatus Woesearchaeota archaeon]
MGLFAKKEEPKTLTGILLSASVGIYQCPDNDVDFDNLNNFYDELITKLHLPEKITGNESRSEIGNGTHRIVDEKIPYHGHSCLRSFKGVHFQNHADVYVYLTEDDAGLGGAEMYCGVFITNKQDGHSQNEHNRTRQKEKLLEQFPILAKFDESGPDITSEMLKEVNANDRERLKLLGPCFGYIY